MPNLSEHDYHKARIVRSSKDTLGKAFYNTMKHDLEVTPTLLAKINKQAGQDGEIKLDQFIKKIDNIPAMIAEDKWERIRKIQASRKAAEEGIKKHDAFYGTKIVDGPRSFFLPYPTCAAPRKSRKTCTLSVSLYSTATVYNCRAALKLYGFIQNQSGSIKPKNSTTLNEITKELKVTKQTVKRWIRQLIGIGAVVLHGDQLKTIGLKTFSRYRRDTKFTVRNYRCSTHMRTAHFATVMQIAQRKSLIGKLSTKTNYKFKGSLCKRHLNVSISLSLLSTLLHVSKATIFTNVKIAQKLGYLNIQVIKEDMSHIEYAQKYNNYSCLDEKLYEIDSPLNRKLQERVNRLKPCRYTRKTAPDYNGYKWTTGLQVITPNKKYRETATVVYDHAIKGYWYKGEKHVRITRTSIYAFGERLRPVAKRNINLKRYHQLKHTV